MTKSPEQSNAFPAPSGIEIGNLKNQLSSTTSSLERTRGDRAQLETAVSNSSSELASLQAQLEAARTAYTTESSLLSSLQTRAANQTSELAELRSKLITAESDLSGLRVERAEVEQSVLRDKEEIRGLKAKIAEMDRETERLKAEAETKRKDARQQKGMVAITRKQVERSEEQRGRAREDLASIGSEPAAIERAASPTSLASPAGSVRSTNPFERMTSPLGSVAMPSAPIPALSPQPTGTSTAAKALSPQPTGSRAAPPPPPSRAKSPSTDVPTSSFSAASIGAAVAAGATAAVGAVAATVSAVVGGDDEKAPSVDTSEIGKSPVQAGQEPRKSTEERFPDLEAPAPASGPSAPSGLSAFDDAFGVVPNATGSQAPPMPSTSTAAFDEAFGAPAPVTASAPTGFDDAFAEPTSTAAPSTGFDDAFASTGTPTAPSAGFDDAFGTSASAPASSAPPAFDDAFATTASPPAQATVGADEASSDEEDDGPEPAEGYKYGRSTSAGSGAIGAGSIERSPFEELPPALPTDYASGGSADPVARPPSAAPSSVDAFEDAQQNVMSSPAPAPTATAARASASMDDFDAFDREFDDLPTESGAAAPTIKTSNNSTVLPDDDDDDFDKAFDKLDDFAPPPAAASHAPASHGAAAPSSSAFDSAFADFDQSPPHSATAPPHGDGGFGSAFDDSFDAPPPVSQGLPAGAGAPALPARKPTAAGAQEDDVPAVKEVRCAAIVLGRST
jgi:epidermal growth factor receptor substrate 15